MTDTDMPFLLVRAYFEIGVPWRVPNDDCVIFGVAALAGVATAPSPATTSNTANLRIALLPWVRAECERSHAKMSSPGRAAAGAYHQLGKHLDVRRSAVRRLYRRQQQPQAAPSHLVEILTHGGERRDDVRRLGDVVEPDESGVGVHAPAGLVQGAQRAQRDLVV